MTTYTVDYLKRLVSAIDQFAGAFEQWSETQVELDHQTARGIYPTVSLREGQDPAVVQHLELDVAQAAGAAARAVAETGAQYKVDGIGLIDPVANWSLMSSPKAVFAPQDVRMTVATVRGRLQTLIDEAETAEEAAVPGFSPSAFHPVIWAAAAAHWTTHQYRVAVREAAEALSLHWKDRLSRHDVNDTEFWQQTLAPSQPQPGKPKLAWPGSPTEKTVKSMRGGLEPLTAVLKDIATGLNLTVRNITTHSRTELSEQEAMERLGAYSYLARLLDQCEVRRADGDEAASASNPLGGSPE